MIQKEEKLATVGSDQRILEVTEEEVAALKCPETIPELEFINEKFYADHKHSLEHVAEYIKIRSRIFDDKVVK